MNLHGNSSRTSVNNVRVFSSKSGSKELKVVSTSYDGRQSEPNEDELCQNCSSRSCRRRNGHPIFLDLANTYRNLQDGTPFHRNAPCNLTSSHTACDMRTLSLHKAASPASFHSNNLLWLSHRKVDMLLGGTLLCMYADRSLGFAHKVHHRTIALGHHTSWSRSSPSHSDSFLVHPLQCILGRVQDDRVQDTDVGILYPSRIPHHSYEPTNVGSTLAPATSCKSRCTLASDPLDDIDSLDRPNQIPDHQHDCSVESSF